MDWDNYPSFRKEEMQCKHTKECNMHPEVMRILQAIRDEIKQPIFISSGFRSVKHPVEQSKSKPGEHTLGMAVDIVCHGMRALDIIRLALKHDIRRIGVHQKGNVNSRFVHIGIANRYSLEFPEALWTY